jgi:DNA-binding response OmpR family regulator
MGAQMKVIVASVDPRIRAWVGKVLGPPWELIDATDGLDARRRAQTDAPDLLIADETMETYGAFGLARDVKQLSKPPAVIVLLERAQDTWLAKWSGADRWFVRPVNPFALAGAARELSGEPAVRVVKEGTA